MDVRVFMFMNDYNGELYRNYLDGELYGHEKP